MSEHNWQVFTAEELSERVGGNKVALFEFVRSPGLSSIVYKLPAGSKDMQAPHVEDEIYFVLGGRATLRVAGQERKVAPRNILFVRAMTIHSFFDIEEDLIVVGVFGSQSSVVRRASYSGG